MSPIRHFRRLMLFASLLALLNGCPDGGRPVRMDVASGDADLSFDLYDQDVEDSTPELDVELQDSLDLNGDADAPPPEDSTELDILPDETTPPEPLVTWCVRTATGCLAEDPLNLTLTQHDIEAAHPGLQVYVEVSTENVPVGTQCQLFLDGTEVDSLLLATSDFRFSNMNVSHALTPCHELTLSIDGLPAMNRVLCADTGGCAPNLSPDLLACQSQDMDPETPGFQLQFTVSTSAPGCDIAWIDGDVVATPQAPLVEGKASFLVTMDEGDSPYFCLEKHVVAHAWDSAATDREETDSAIVTLDDAAPVVAITHPAGSVLNLLNDENQNPDDGLQVTLEGTVTGANAADAVSLLLDGEVLETTTVGGGTFSFPVTLSQTASYDFRVQTQDCCGNLGEDHRVLLGILFDTDARILYPGDGATWLAKDNGPAGTSRTYDGLFQVLAPVAQVGQTLQVQCRRAETGSIWRLVGSLLISSVTEVGVQDVPVSLDTVLLTRSMVCRARYGSNPPVVTPEINLTVALPPPALSILSPLQGETISPAAVSVSGAATELSGQPVHVALLQGGVELASGSTLANNIGFTFDADWSFAADGDYQIAVDSTDAFGNQASQLPGNLTLIDIHLDQTAPTLFFVSPVPGSTCTPPTCADTIPSLAGHQIVVQVQVTGEPDPSTVEVCLEVNGSTPQCAAPESVPLGWVATFYGVSLISGDNVLVARASDALQQEADPVTTTVRLEVASPRVELLNPVKDIVFAQLPLKVDAQILHPSTLDPLAGATVQLSLNGANVQSAPSDALGQVSFSLVSLPENETQLLRLSATHPDFSLAGTSESVRATYKTVLPSATISIPQDGAVLSLLSEACDPGIAGCRLDVTVNTLDAEDASAVLLKVQCANGQNLQFPGKVDNGTCKLKDVGLPDNTTCNLEAEVTDLASQKATSDSVAVRVDRTVPKLCGFGLGVYNLMASTLDESTEDGYQFTVTVKGGAMDAGSTLKLSILAEDDTLSELSLPVNTALPATSCVDLSFPQSTFEEASYLLIIEATDTAGNTASISKAVQFFLAEEAVAIDNGSYVPDSIVCSSNSQCASGVCTALEGVKRCAVPWRDAEQNLLVRTTPESLFDGTQNLRLCSNAPGLSGETCAYEAEGVFHVVKTTSTAGGLANLTLTRSEVQALPQGLHRMFIEARRNDTDQWLSSKENGLLAVRDRRVLVDTIYPTLTGLNFPSDVEPLGILNASEDIDGSPNHFLVSATVPNAPEGNLTLAVNGTGSTTHSLATGVVEVPLFLPNGLAEVCAYPFDLVGNAGVPECDSLTVDTLPPSLQFLKPNTSPLIVGSSADVALSTDVATLPVVLERFLDGAWTQWSSASAVGGVAQFPGLLALDGTYQMRASVSDPAGNKTTVSTTPPVVVVDRTAPTLTLEAPLNGAVFHSQDDFSPLGGFQLEIIVTLEGASTWTIQSQRCLDAEGTNCGAFITKVPLLTQDLSNHRLSILITISQLLEVVEFRHLKFTARDEAGNEVTAEATIQFELGECMLVFSSLSESGFINNMECPIPGLDCDETEVPLEVTVAGACGDYNGVALLENGVLSETESDIVDSRVTFLKTVTHGSTLALEAALMLDGNPTGPTSGGTLVGVDLHDPLVSVVEPVGDTLVCSMAEDANPALDGCQLDVIADLSDETLQGGSVALYRMEAGLMELLGDEVPTGTAYQSALYGITLPQGYQDELLLEVTDKAGNQAEVSWDSVVDVVPPEGILLAELNPESDIHRRRPQVRLAWSAVGDDGSDSGPASSYDIRYAQTPIVTQADFDAACDASLILGTMAVPTPASPGETETFELSGPDERASSDPCRFIVSKATSATFYFAVQASDDLGNRSTISPEGVVSTDLLHLDYTRIARGTLSGPGFGSYVSDLGDIDGDALSELGIGGDAVASAFCIIKGHADPEIEVDVSNPATENVACYQAPYNDGQGVSLASLGDVNGDGFLDVSSQVYFASNGTMDDEFRVYLGNASGFVDDTPALTIEIDATASYHGYAAMLGAGNFNGDTTSEGRPLDDIVLSTPQGNKLYIIPGSEEFSTQNPRVLTLTVAQDLTDWNIITVQGLGFASNALFGHKAQLVGDILPSSGGARFDDLFVAKRAAGGAAFLIPGRATTSSQTVTVHATLDGTGTEDSVSVRMIPDPTWAANGNFVDDMASGFDMDGDNVPDLAFSHPNFSSTSQSQLYLFFGAALRSGVGTTVQLNATTAAGTNIFKSSRGLRLAGNRMNIKPLGNFDGLEAVSESSTDLAYGDFNGYNYFGNAYIRLNRSGYASDGNRVPTIDLQLVNPFQLGDTSFGGFSMVAVPDFDGDGLPDLFVGTKDLGYGVLVH